MTTLNCAYYETFWTQAITPTPNSDVQCSVSDRRPQILLHKGLLQKLRKHIVAVCKFM